MEQTALSRAGAFATFPNEVALKVVYEVGDNLETLLTMRLVSSWFNALVCEAIPRHTLKQYQDIDFAELFRANWVHPEWQTLLQGIRQQAQASLPHKKNTKWVGMLKKVRVARQATAIMSLLSKFEGSAKQPARCDQWKWLQIQKNQILLDQLRAVLGLHSSHVSYSDKRWQQILALLHTKVHVHAKDKYGNTPLHKAARQDYSDTCITLVKAGANVNAAGKSNISPLHWAAWKGHSNTCTTLISLGASRNAAMACGETPLHQAAGEGHADTCAILVNAGANVNAKNADGNTPLHEAAWFNRPNTCTTLIEAGANPNVGNKAGNTPLHFAASKGHLDTCIALIGKGVDIDATKDNGNTALHLAACEGHLNICTILIQGGANINATNKGGTTPLVLASLFNQDDTVKLLRNHGARDWCTLF